MMNGNDEEIEDDNDAAWAHQQQLEQEMLEDDQGYVEFLQTVTNSYSTQLRSN
jgi:hypothetical protein